MFQQSHFQKMAKELGVDSVTYEKEYNGFMAKLKNFHESKGTPFRRLPWLGGQFLDLYLLYRKVTSSGGWLKVTEDKKWRDIAEVFNLPPTCTNAAFALRQHYSRYLESFERINFFGEDAEDVLAAGRPHTPVGGGITVTNIASDYISVISTSKDSTRNFDKLVLSLQCGMPNEVDFAINICMLLSNVSNSVFNLSKAPAVVDTLLAHVGVFSEDSHGLKGLYNEWYIKQDVKRDFIKFWRESLAVVNIRDILYGREGNKTTSEESLFHPSRPRIGGARDVECQRVAQVCMILYNFSFDIVNASVLASHSLCLRFLVLCICSDHGFLQRMAWETLSNLAEKMLMEPIESTDTQMFFQMLHIFLGHKDRHHLMNAMHVLGKLCALEGNDDVIEAGLEQEAYELLIRVLIISDVQLVISSLESLYNLSGVGQVTSDHIAEVHHSIDILVCLVTMDAESFGPEALSEVQIVENRVVATVPVTPKPQPTPTPVVSQQHKEPVQPPQGSHSSPSPSPGPSQAPSTSPAPAPTPPPTAVKTTGTEIDPETFTFNWLQGTYEYSPGNSVSRIDIYADYLSSCSRLARVGILNATAFNRIIKLAFPDGQLKRAQSGTQVQYVLAGLKRRSNPLPVKSRTDAPLHQPSTPAAGQRVLPTPAVSVQQSVARTPASSTSPAWNPSKQQSIPPSPQPLATSVSRPFYQRPVQGPVAGGGQVGGNPQQATPGMVQLPRRPNMPGGNQLATSQVARQFPEVGMQQLAAQSSLAAQRQTAAVPVQRTSLERLPSQQRASVEGTIISHQANPQSFQQHLNQAHVPQLQRMPVPVQSSGLQRPIAPQQGTNPAQPQQVPCSPSQRVGSNSFPPQFAAKSPLTPTHGLQESIHPSQNPLPRSPLQPRSPKYPTTSRPANTPPPTGTVQRPSPAVPPAYRPAPPYQQSPTMFNQQQIRQTSLGLNGRSYGSYPPLAPKPPQGVNIQGFPQHGQLVSHVPVNPGGHGQYAGFPQLPRSSQKQPSTTVRPHFKSHGVASNMPPLPTLSSTYAAGPVGPLKVLPSELVGTNSRPINGPDVRQGRSESISSSRPEGVVLIAQEERAADVVSTGLLDGAEEQQIVVVENRNRTELQTKAKVTAVSKCSTDVHSLSRSSAENICSSRQNIVPNPPRTVVLASSNGSLKRNFDVQTSEPDKVYVLMDEGQNGQRDRESENCGPPKRPRLEDRLASLDNDLEHSTTLPSRTGSPTSLLNGDIKGDPRNKLMDKLLDKDLHIPLNGVCGIDSSELDLMASDGERLSSSKASSPDLFGSETNSDFGKYLEESDTDTGLFSDLLQGDLRIDPMENGTDSQHSLEETKLDSKSLNMPPFHVGPFGESASTLIEKGNVPAVAVQDKVPIPPVSGLDTQTLHGQNITPINRYPATINPSDGIAVNYGNTVALKPTFPQNFDNEVYHKVAPYQQQRKLSPNLDNGTQAENVSLEMQGRTRTSGSTVVMQKNAFPRPTIPSNAQQVVAGQGASKMLASGIPQTILSRNYQTTVANTMSSCTQGLNVTHPLVAAPTSQNNAKPVLTSQTPVLGGQTVSVTQNANLIPGMQHSDGSPVVVHRPQQLNAVQYSGPRIQAGTSQTSSLGVGPSSMGATPGVPPYPSLPRQHPPTVYDDIRTRSMVTPGSSVFEATTVSQGRQPSAASLPSQQQQVPMAPTGKGLEQSTVGSSPRSEDVIPTPSPLGNSTDVVVPQVDSLRPYKCRWAKCSSSFDSSKGLFAHVVSEHVPRDSLVMSCMWEGCQPVRRSRSSLLFHLQQKHSEPTPVSSTPPLQIQAQHQSSHVQHPPQPQAPPSNPPTSYVPAYHFLARMLQSLQGDEESPLTKTVRLTAALVLRNVAQYSALARSMLRRHEHHLSLVAMSNSEAAHAVAACLSELSPHRKTSCNGSEAFIWALDR